MPPCTSTTCEGASPTSPAPTSRPSATSRSRAGGGGPGLPARHITKRDRCVSLRALLPCSAVSKRDRSVRVREEGSNGLDPDRAYQRRWWTLAVLCLSLLVIGLDNTILNVALPTLVRELGAKASQLQWIVDAYALVFASLLLTAGSLGDRYGRRLVLGAGLSIFGIGSVLSAFAASPGSLIGFRALMGIGGALIMPSTLSIVTNVFPAEERGRAIGIWAGFSGIGIAIGPVIGGWLLENFWWGSVFFINVPVIAVAILASFAAALVLLGGFVFAELRVRHPMMDVRLFENRRFTAASLGTALVFFALFGSLFFLSQYLQFVLGYGTLEVGVRLVPVA